MAAPSAAWSHFTKQPDGKVKCRHCGQVKNFSGVTSNLLAHLTQHHRAEYERDTLLPAAAAAAAQPSLPAVMSIFKPHTAKDQAVRVEMLIDFLVATKIAPNIFNNPRAVALFKKLDPRFQLPNRKAIAGTHIPAAVARVKLKVMAVLRSSISISLTLDLWTEKRQPFLVVNAHCITASHQHESFCIAFERVPESHTAANLLVRVTAAVHDFIDPPNRNKLVSVTTDTTGNVKKLGHDSPWLWVPCMAHVINLTVHDAIDKPFLAELIARARSLATAFRNVQQLSMGLEQRQKQLGVPIQPLILDVVTRWNSLYLMLERLCKQRQNIQVVLITTGNTARDLTPADWALIPELLTVLEPFYTFTTLLSGELYCTMSVVCPSLYGICKNLSTSAREHAPVALLDAALREAITTRLLPFLSGQSKFRQACALDPRFKAHELHAFMDSGHDRDVWGFILADARAELAKRDQTGSVVAVAQGLPPVPPLPLLDLGTAAPPAVPAAVAHREKRPYDRLLGLGGPDEAVEGPMSLEQQLEQYRKIPITETSYDGTYNVLGWWREQSSRLPDLYYYAMRLLAMQATEVSAERAFSWAGGFFVDGRARMSAQTLSDYMFLYSNSVRPRGQGGLAGAQGKEGAAAATQGTGAQGAGEGEPGGEVEGGDDWELWGEGGEDF